MGDVRKWLGEATVYLVEHGSRAYGTSTPESDYDVRGIAIPPLRYFLGATSVFEQAEGCADVFPDIVPSAKPDVVVYDIRKFLRLASDCNPNVLELLYVDDQNVLRMSPVGELIRQNRDLFLSRRAKHTFTGYAISQLKRIKTHRRWLIDPPTAPPERADFGLPPRTVIPADQLAAAQADIKRKLDAWEWRGLEDLARPEVTAVMEHVAKVAAEIHVATDQGGRFVAAGRLLGYEDNFLDLLEREKRYRGAMENWRQYQTWKQNRNPARAALEAKFGHDAKHASHLYRLLVMCREILMEGRLVVRRPDAAQIMAIRNGAWSYDKLVGWAEQQDAEMQELYRTSTLRHSPDRDAIDDLCGEAVQAHHRLYLASDLVMDAAHG